MPWQDAGTARSAASVITGRLGVCPAVMPRWAVPWPAWPIGEETVAGELMAAAPALVVTWVGCDFGCYADRRW